MSKPPTANKENKLFLLYTLIKPLITIEQDNEWEIIGI